MASKQWKDVRPGDRVRMPSGEFRVMSYDVTSGIINLLGDDGKVYPGKPPMGASVEIVDPDLVTIEEVAEVTSTTTEETVETLVKVVLGATRVGVRDTRTGEWACPSLESMTGTEQATHLLMFHRGNRTHDGDDGIIQHIHGRN